MQSVFFFFFNFGTPKSTDSQWGHLGKFLVKKYWWAIWASCQMMKKCCRPIWVPKSGKNFRPEKRYSKIWFLYRDIFCGKKKLPYPNSNSPLFGLIVEKCFGRFSQQYCRLQKSWKVTFIFIGHFLALLLLHTLVMAQKCCQSQKWSTGLLFLSALP